MKNRDGRIDINLYNGLAGRLKAAEQGLEEKDRLLIDYIDKYYEMKDKAEALQAKLAARDQEIMKLQALLSARIEA